MKTAQISSQISLILTCADMGGFVRQGRVTMIATATALAPAPNSVMLAVITDTPAGSVGGKPHPLREVTAIRVAMALTLFAHRGVCDVIAVGRMRGRRCGRQGGEQKSVQ